jgi:hypothetical protein
MAGSGSESFRHGKDAAAHRDEGILNRKARAESRAVTIRHNLSVRRVFANLGLVDNGCSGYIERWANTQPTAKIRCAGVCYGIQ